MAADSAAPDAAPGTTWADVALAVIEFSRSDPKLFLGVMAALVAITLLAIFAIYLMLPKTLEHLAKAYAKSRENAKEGTQDLFNKGDDGAS